MASSVLLGPLPHHGFLAVGLAHHTMPELRHEHMLPLAPQLTGTRASGICAASCLQSCPTLRKAHTPHVNDVPSQLQLRAELLKSDRSPAFPWQEHSFDNFPEIAALLRRHGESKDLLRGKQVHAFIRKRGYDYSTFIGNCLVQMYGNCGSIAHARAAYDVIHSPNLHSRNILIQAYALNGHFEDATTVFESMPKRDVVSWTAIISSAAQHGFNVEALALFRRMQHDGIEPNSITFTSVLEACTILEEGFEIHTSIVQRGFDADVVVATALITMYGNCESLSNARYVFNTMPEKNVVSWSAIITALTQNARAEESLEVFHQMNKEDVVYDKVIYVCALNACASLGALKEGQDVHASIIADGFEHDMVVGNALVTMYGKSDDLDSAITIFMKVGKRDAISWTAIISACAQNGDSKEALDLFDQMKLQGYQPQIATCVSVLDACSDLIALDKGREAHLAVTKYGSEADLFVGNSLVNLYGKCGSLDEARSVFVKVQQRDTISWNGIIAACAQNGQGMEALEHFHQMENEGIEPNNVTFICVIEACTSLGALKEGRQTHAALLDGGHEPHAMVGSSLITMYGKCGSLDEARIVFRRMRERNVVAWSAMLAACAKNGHETEALDLFHQMQHNGVRPNEITLISVLTACSHSGGFYDGVDAFATMKRDHDVKYMLDHYTCMVDLLGRAGHLPEAEDLLNSIPNVTIVAPWSSLLCACRLHGDVERGERAASRCLELDPDSASPYLELTRMYAAAGRWEDAAKAEEALKKCAARHQLE